MRAFVAVLRARTLLDHGGVTVADVACRHHRGPGDAAEQTLPHTIVFVRRGCFVRHADGDGATLDPTVAYWMRPGEEERYDHPHDGGDDCTAVTLDPALLAALFGGEPALPRAPVRTTPAVDLAHRLLLAAARRGEPADALAERTVRLAAAVLERTDPARVASGRPATARARRALADGAREALAEDPGRSLTDLARLLAVSPHHLSRVFSAETGIGVARHRLRLRTRDALERLAGGERDLARVAADAGFGDHSHLCRVLRAETGATPAALRAALR